MLQRSDWLRTSLENCSGGIDVGSVLTIVGGIEEFLQHYVS